MNPLQVYMCSPSWTLLPPPSPYHPSGSSQCTSPKHPVSCIEAGLATRFIHDILHVSMPFYQIFPPSPSPRNCKHLTCPKCHIPYQEAIFLSELWTLLLFKKALFQFSSVQSLSRVWLFGTPWIAARQASLSITNSQSSPGLMSSESVMPSSHLILCRPLLLLPAIPPSIRVFSNESTLRMRWPKYWSLSPSNEHPGLISFGMD